MASPRKVAVAIAAVLPSPSPSSSSSSSSSPPEPTLLLVASRKKHDRYVFPKGGIEQGESPAEAAEREAWEEAGLQLGAATHLTHLLTLHDPSPHILSPTQDPSSPSFVPSCEYSFELFVLPAPVPAPTAGAEDATGAGGAVGAGVREGEPPVAAPIQDGSSSSAAPSSSSTTPALDPHPVSVIPISLLPSSSPAPSRSPSDPELFHPALPPVWPEFTERHRRLVTGWSAVEQAVSWGRREGVMREALRAARGEWEEWFARTGGRIEEE
ncbi:hypothetical protein JCM8097_000513 [Rhodosporidiobolus ruineniae]